MATFVIAEAASSWRFGPDHLANAFRLITAAKACDASAFKVQWTSDPALMAKRRHGAAEDFEILAYPFEWLEKLKAECDRVQIEFMTTVFIPADIAKIAPLVKRFKVASAESSDEEFVKAHFAYSQRVIVSHAFGTVPDYRWYGETDPETKATLPLADKFLHCVCSYPTPIEQANLKRVGFHKGVIFHGLSDHTTSVLTGALAVAAGASVIEKHVRLHDTPMENPDFPHSLTADCRCTPNEIAVMREAWNFRRTDELLPEHKAGCFAEYVANIREAELAMGHGRNEAMECEKANEGRRVKA